MLILYENDEQYIYYAIVNTQDGPKYTWDEYASFILLFYHFITLLIY